MQANEELNRIFDGSNMNWSKYVVERFEDVLKKHSKYKLSLKNSKLLLIGLSCCDDEDCGILTQIRPLDVWRELESRGASVIYHDPYCKSVLWKYGNGSTVVKSAELTEELLTISDAVIITAYYKRNLDYQMVLRNANLIFDTKNAIVSAFGKNICPNIEKLYMLNLDNVTS